MIVISEIYVICLRMSSPNQSGIFTLEGKVCIHPILMPNKSKTAKWSSIEQFLLVFYSTCAKGVKRSPHLTMNGSHSDHFKTSKYHFSDKI